jgi:GTP-binding protein EngB required for normal cell division
VSPLNESQARRVSATFSEVNRHLEHVASAARLERSPLSDVRADLDPDVGRLLAAFVGLAQRRLVATLDRLGIPRPKDDIGAAWSIGTALRFADIALSELDRASLRGYGAVDDAAAAELEALAAELRALLGRATAMLQEADTGGLKAKVAALPGSVGEVLREIERISRERALPEIRPLLAAAADRAVTSTFDVGVFGRVSAGKSSLINALVGHPVLPVGVTPVTAAPVRIAQGPPGAVVHLVDGGSRVVALDAVAEYVTEAQNPENQRGVRELELSYPTVPAGLRLLDTPGVGSMRTAGQAQAFAWLPRCDLGLVLIAAGAPVGHEDLSLITGLRHAGIACHVLVSKADLLAAADLAAAVEYVRREVRGDGGDVPDLRVEPVSTQPGATQHLDWLRRELLEPLAADHRRAAAHALLERLHRLVAATNSALAGREDGTEDSAVALQRARITAAERITGVTDRLSRAGAAVLESMAAAVTTAWQNGSDARAAARTAAVETVTEPLQVVRDALDAFRRAAGTSSTLDARRVPPLFDPEILDRLPPLKPPGAARRLLGSPAAHALEPVAAEVDEAVRRYAERLRAWGLARVDELTAGSLGGTARSSGALTPGLARLDTLIDESDPRGAPGDRQGASSSPYDREG